MYIVIIILPFVVLQSLPYWSEKLRLIVTGIWIAFLMLDTTHIMLTLKRDEHEHKIESLAERNAAWAMMGVLVLGLLYQVFRSALTETITIDWFLVAALLGGALVKTLSNVLLERRPL